MAGRGRGGRAGRGGRGRGRGGKDGRGQQIKTIVSKKSTGTLSAMFEKLKKSSGKVAQVGQVNRRLNSEAMTKNKRKAGISARRSGKDPKSAAAQAGKSKIGKGGNRGRGRSGGRGGGRGRGRGGAKAKKNNNTESSLDQEMDVYWDKVGKGTERKKDNLDAEMDDYWKNSTGKDTNDAGAAGDAAVATAMAE